MRPAFYALSPGGWRDYVTLLHVPYTLWHLSYVAIGAGLAAELNGTRLVETFAAFFLAMGVGAHALDELNGRPLQTRIPDTTLIALAAVSIGAAVAIGVVVAIVVRPLAARLRRGRLVHRRRLQPRAVRRPLPLGPLVRGRLGLVPAR